MPEDTDDTRPRYAISRIGVMTLADDGSIFMDPEWVFRSELVDQETIQTPPAQPETGMVMGWTLQQLHAIAHGVPCHCPVGHALDREQA